MSIPSGEEKVIPCNVGKKSKYFVTKCVMRDKKY